MKSIGKYQVIEELGASATGETYRARDAFRNREFAVKILQTVPGLTAEAKERFCQHLASCAELTHRQIAKVHDLGEVDEGIFVATEWRTGMDLRRFMQDNRDVPLDQKLAVIAQVAEGLAFAQSRGIAHGNLKPSNIFVDAARDVSILDFGIAKWLAAMLEAGSRPQGLLANYLAPEQILGQPFDARSDIFSLGLMLYELASGKYPFSADPGLVPREIVHGEPEPLSKLDPQVPEELEKLVARALKKDPEQRLQTAEEFASGLYLAAQQLRRTTSAAVTPDPPSVEHMVIEPAVNQQPPALTPEPVIPPPLPPAISQEVSPQNVSTTAPPAPLVPAQKVRERPQDAEPPARPWSARSYAAGGARPPSSNANPPTPSVAPNSSTSHEPPAYQPPQSFLRPSTPLPELVPPKNSKTMKRVLIAALGLIIAVAFVSSLISRQNLRASQNRNRAVNTTLAPITDAAAPAPKPLNQVSAATSEARAPKHEEPASDDAVNPEVSAKQVLNGPVRTLWESGRYAQALAFVNQVLTTDPSNEDARSWKKKIREAQAAEAALK